MPIELFKKIISEVSQVTKLIALHLMGDPMVHPHLLEMLEICQTQNLKVFFVTNGVLLKNPEILLHPAIQQVSFSLHSFTDNFPWKDPSAYLNKIFDFTEMAFRKRPTMFINYRLWNLKSRSGNEALNPTFYQAIEERFHISIPRDFDSSSQKNLKLKNYLSLHYDTEFVWPALELPVIGETGTCYGLRSHFGVLVDGTVVPCCLDKEGMIPLGKLTLDPLKKILSSSKAKAIVEGFQRHRLVEDL